MSLPGRGRRPPASPGPRRGRARGSPASCRRRDTRGRSTISGSEPLRGVAWRRSWRSRSASWSRSASSADAAPAPQARDPVPAIPGSSGTALIAPPARRPAGGAARRSAPRLPQSCTARSKRCTRERVEQALEPGRARPSCAGTAPAGRTCPSRAGRAPAQRRLPSSASRKGRQSLGAVRVAVHEQRPDARHAGPRARVAGADPVDRDPALGDHGASASIRSAI